MLESEFAGEPVDTPKDREPREQNDVEATTEKAEPFAEPEISKAVGEKENRGDVNEHGNNLDQPRQTLATYPFHSRDSRRGVDRPQGWRSELQSGFGGLPDVREV